MHGKEELEQLDDHERPTGVTGLDMAQIKVMTGAMSIGEAPINDIYTMISKVEMLYLDTLFDAGTVEKITQAGFSRIPVAYSKQYPVIVGVILVKKLLSVEIKGEAIASLYNRRELYLHMPLFLTQHANLKKLAVSF